MLFVTACDSALCGSSQELGPWGRQIAPVQPPSPRSFSSAYATGHAVGGNDRVRFAGSGTAVAVDEAWKAELSGLRLRLWTLLASPGLRHFGYPLGVSRSGPPT